MTSYESKLGTTQTDYARLKPLLTDERRDLVFLMRQAEAAERYEDMAMFGRRVALLAHGQLTREERNLFAIGHKQLITARRSAYRALVSFGS